MKPFTLLFTLLLACSFSATSGAIPIVTPGPPAVDAFTTLDPGSIEVEFLGLGESVATQVSLQIHPLCISPFQVDLETTGPAGLFSNLTGALLNGCGGDISLFDIELTGDGLAHSFDINFVDAEFGGNLASIPVNIWPGEREQPQVPLPATMGLLLLGLGVLRATRH
ncbi:MAG: hypothetical protein R3228_04565 [Halioglobus sp.]|nr:hypothetical protein [Halioglobus sp.]